MIRVNRWLHRNKIIIFFCLLCFLLLFHWLAGNIHIKEQYNPVTETCHLNLSEAIVNKLCKDFSLDSAHGNLCRSLCLAKTLHVYRCVHHGNTHALYAKQKSRDLVLKRKDNEGHGYLSNRFKEMIGSEHTDIKFIRERYLELLSDEIRSVYGSDSLALFLKDISHPILQLVGKRLAAMTLSEMMSSLNLLAQNEFVMLALYSRYLSSFPDVVGTCGGFYAVEASQPYDSIFHLHQSSVGWKDRVEMALSFLRMFDEYETLNLHHCDVQEGNFGVKGNTVSAIDVDLVFSHQRLKQVLAQPECSKNSDCDFFDCQSKCDGGNCTTITTTNNLQLLCRDIFWLEGSDGLLTHTSTPRNFKDRIDRIIEECLSMGELSMQSGIVTALRTKLQKLLQELITHLHSYVYF